VKKAHEGENPVDIFSPRN